jgi:GNAT superfamily N-acetyltransferase
MLANGYQIEYTDTPEWDIIGGGLTKFNHQHAGDDRPQRLCFALKAPDGTVVGGVIGIVYWDWLAVDLLFLPEALRGQGYGSQLLTLIEAEGRRRGARHVHLDTFSFQAPEFYERHGYRIFGELPDFPPGHTRYYLTKELD